MPRSDNNIHVHVYEQNMYMILIYSRIANVLTYYLLFNNKLVLHVHVLIVSISLR